MKKTNEGLVEGRSCLESVVIHQNELGCSIILTAKLDSNVQDAELSTLTPGRLVVWLEELGVRSVEYVTHVSPIQPAYKHHEQTGNYFGYCPTLIVSSLLVPKLSFGGSSLKR